MQPLSFGYSRPHVHLQFVLAGLQWSVCLVYLDDIIIYSRSIAEHLYRLRLVLQRLRHGGLKSKPSKCHFLNKSVKYLGHIISAEGIRTDPDKIAVIHQWPAPTNLKELRQFLGFASYYRRFIKTFANIAAPLYKLLTFPRFDEQFIVDCDAINVGLGAILSQVVNGEEQVIMYSSRTLTKAERKYSATRKEMLALVWAIVFPALLGGERFQNKNRS